MYQNSAVVSILIVCIAVAAISIRKFSIPTVLDKIINRIRGDQTDFNTEENYFARGVFAPSRNAVHGLKLEKISGSLPPELEGAYIYNGPNPTPGQLHQRYHLFDGHGFLRMLRIKDGEAVFSADYVQTPKFKLTQELKTEFFQLGDGYGVLGLLKAALVQPMITKAAQLRPLEFMTANTAMTTTEQDQLLALHEGGLPFRIQLLPNNTFVSVGYDSFGSALNRSMSAHPKRDPIDGSLWFHGYSLQPGISSYHVGQIVDGQLVKFIPVDSPVNVTGFSHDLFMTKNYVIVVETSAGYDLQGILTDSLFFFDQKRNLRMGVLPKMASSQSEIRWFEFDRPLSILHGIAAWEEEDSRNIIIHSPVSEYWNCFHPTNSSGVNNFTLAELKLSLQNGQTSFEYYQEDSDKNVEFPALHPDCYGEKVHFAYVGGYDGDNRQGFRYLYKVDLFTKQVRASIELPPGRVMMEPCVIPKRGDNGLCDEVFVAAFVINIDNQNEGEWIVFDGENMNTQPVAHLRMPNQRFVHGFHGLWMDENQLQRHYNLASK